MTNDRSWDMVYSAVVDLTKVVSSLNEKLINLTETVNNLNEKMDKKFDEVHERFDQLESDTILSVKITTLLKMWIPTFSLDI